MRSQRGSPPWSPTGGAEIRLGGMFLLVYDWMAVFKDGRRVLAECHQAIAAYGPAAGRLTGT